MVTTDYDVSHNYQINNVARTQGSDGNNNYGALAELINDQFGLYIDGYVAIRLEALVGAGESAWPHSGLRGRIRSTTATAAAWSRACSGWTAPTAEFFLRARETYTQGDIQRLNVQRYFYSAHVRPPAGYDGCGDIAKILPVVMNYMETDLSVSKLVSAGGQPAQCQQRPHHALPGAGVYGPAVLPDRRGISQ